MKQLLKFLTSNNGTKPMKNDRPSISSWRIPTLVERVKAEYETKLEDGDIIRLTNYPLLIIFLEDQKMQIKQACKRSPQDQRHAWNLERVSYVLDNQEKMRFTVIERKIERDSWKWIDVYVLEDIHKSSYTFPVSKFRK